MDQPPAAIAVNCPGFFARKRVGCRSAGTRTWWSHAARYDASCGEPVLHLARHRFHEQRQHPAGVAPARTAAGAFAGEPEDARAGIRIRGRQSVPGKKEELVSAHERVAQRPSNYFLRWGVRAV